MVGSPVLISLIICQDITEPDLIHDKLELYAFTNN